MARHEYILVIPWFQVQFWYIIITGINSYNASSKCIVVRRGANNLIVPRATGLYMNLVLVLSLVAVF